MKKACSIYPRIVRIASPTLLLTALFAYVVPATPDSKLLPPHPAFHWERSNANDRTIRVGASAAANTTTIAGAVSLVPLHQTEGWTILVEAGVYRERTSFHYVVVAILKKGVNVNIRQCWPAVWSTTYWLCKSVCPAAAGGPTSHS